MKIRKPHKPIKSTVLAIGVGTNLLVAMLMAFAAYGGAFDPDERVIASIASMTLPIFLVGSLLLLVADLLIDKRQALIIVGGWIASLPPILTFAPVNFGGGVPNDAEKDDSFTFLTYNILHLWDFRGENPNMETNATLDYILNTDADIVNLQELEMLVPDKTWKVTRQQIDSIKARYPYRSIESGAKQLSLFSKYPFEKVDIDVPSDVDYVMACYKLRINGHDIHLLNVHLKSIGLTPEDKELYKGTLKNIPDSKHELKRELKEVKSQLLSKLAEAFRVRAVQARAIREVLDSIGGPFIVAGDFNDIPGCYAIRTISRQDMHDAYGETAFGPTITYHGDHFYFRIDHILYRGNFRAADIERGKISSSDHNPLLTTFVFEPEK